MSVATSSPTQSEAVGQRMAASGAFDATPVIEVHAETPPVGFVDVNSRLPALPLAGATHSVTVGQAMPSTSLDPPAGESIAASVQAEVPPVGLVETAMLPSR